MITCYQSFTKSNCGQRVIRNELRRQHLKMHRSISLQLLALLLLRLVSGDEDIGLCCLCGGCKPPVRFSEIVDSKGTSCGLLANQMADPKYSARGSSKCINLKSLHYDRCCNADFDPDPIAQAPTMSPGTKFSHGPYAPCNLCIDGSFPTKPTSLTAVAGIPGTPTCQDLYWISKKGNIEERMCRPMQNYFEGPCGCVSGGGNNNNGGGGAPDQNFPVPTPVAASVPAPVAASIPAPSGYPPKQTVPNTSKEDEKLYGTDVRGNLHKKRKLTPKGQTLRGSSN